MAQGRFAARVAEAMSQRKELMLWIRNEAAERTISLMQYGGLMRVDTGFLRASLVPVIGEAFPTVTYRPSADATYSYDGGAVSLVIAGTDINDPITVVYTANYARPREYGSRGQPGDRFVALSAQQWPRIVSEVAAVARTRSGA